MSEPVWFPLSTIYTTCNAPPRTGGALTYSPLSDQAQIKNKIISCNLFYRPRRELAPYHQVAHRSGAGFNPTEQNVAGVLIIPHQTVPHYRTNCRWWGRRGCPSASGWAPSSRWDRTCLIPSRPPRRRSSPRSVLQLPFPVQLVLVPVLVAAVEVCPTGNRTEVHHLQVFPKEQAPTYLPLETAAQDLGGSYDME